MFPITQSNFPQGFDVQSIYTHLTNLKHMPSAPPFEVPAPSLEGFVELTIDWNKLPEDVKSKFMETQKERRVAAAALGAFAIFTSFWTVKAALYYTATPRMVIGVTASLAFVTLTSTITAIVLLCLKLSPNDPVNRLKLRQNAAIYIKEFGCKDIRKHHNKEIISDAELNALISKDVRVLTFPAFEKKHGDVLSFIDDANRIELRKSFLKYCLAQLSWNEILARPEVKELNIELNNLAHPVVLREAQLAMTKDHSYATFVERNGLDAIDYIKEYPNVFDNMAASFMQEFISQNLGLSVLEIEANQTQIAKFGLTFGQNLRIIILQEQWNQLLKESMSYDKFSRQNGGLSIINELIGIGAPANNLVVLQQAFLKMPLDEQEQHKEEMAALKINHHMRNQALLKKWVDKSIQDIVQDSDFKKHLLIGLIPPSHWTETALAGTGTMLIADIGRQMPVLFTSRVLDANSTMKGQPTIRERLNVEIDQCQDDLLKLAAFPDCILQLIDNANLRVQRMVISFICTNLHSYFENTWLGNVKKGHLLIQEYKLMKNEVKIELERAKEVVNQEKIAQKKAIEDATKENQANLDVLEKEKIVSCHNTSKKIKLLSELMQNWII